MKKYFVGAVQIRETAEGIIPLRFTEDQMKFFDPLVYKFRSFNAAGIRLEMMTDSPFLGLSYHAQVKPGITEKLFFDVLLEDQLIASPVLSVNNQAASDWTVRLPLQTGQPQRVTVYLPIHATITVREILLEDGAICDPAIPYERRMLCLGDSITQGSSAVHPSATYAALLARLLGMNLLNQGISGHVFDADSLDPSLPIKPELITIAYGTNDWKLRESLADLKAEASRYIDKVCHMYPDTPIAVLSPLWRSDSGQATAVGEFSEVHKTLRKLAEQHRQVTYIDGLTLIPHQTVYFSDGLHPNDKGFLHMALNLMRYVKPLL